MADSTQHQWRQRQTHEGDKGDVDGVADEHQYLLAEESCCDRSLMSMNKNHSLSGSCAEIEDDERVELCRSVCTRKHAAIMVWVFTSLLVVAFQALFRWTSAAHNTAVQKKSLDTVQSRPGFPSFHDFAGHNASIEVSYDRRSLLLNDQRSFFLSGSMHPVRATRQSWEDALGQAVQNGLNMITMYVMWSAHQPLPDHPIDWKFPAGVGCEGVSYDDDDSMDACRWDLATAVRLAGSRGLFVHIRIGPYTCAEYSYGGIPEWLPLAHPGISMRRYDLTWMAAMEGYVIEVIEYLTEEKLWSYQGGPIILGQIENELGNDMDAPDSAASDIDNCNSANDEQAKNEPAGVHEDAICSDQTKGTSGTTQDYANWCGDLVQKLAPQVSWTMCFGLSASNTVETCNGDCTGYWVEQHGDSGRIQIDQPALLTEFENGFQIWGENASQPTDYFWGRTSRNTGQEVLKWFARGGAHLNYYMWWGGYNRGRSAAAGISNMYAADGVLCPSGQRHHPKFEYLQSLHDMLATIAPALLHRDSALHQDKDLLVKNSNGEWALQGDQRMFEYGAQNTNGPGKDGDGGSENGSLPHVIFVENDANFPVTAWVYGYGAVSLSPASVTVIVDGAVEFDSAIIDGQAEQYQRIFDEDTASELSWTTQPEPLRLSEKDKKVTASTEPIEQTALNIASDVSSDYAWYETNITLNADMDDATLHIDTAEANSFVAYIDGQYVAEANRHFHKEGLVTLDVPIGGIDAGVHRLLLLSESLGYDNLIGRWGVDTKRKMKGIVGSVVLGGSQDGSSTSIVVQSETMASGRRWLSFPGLHWDLGNIRNNNPNDGDDHDGSIEKTDVAAGIATSSVQARWAQTTFQTPPFDSPHRSLFLKVSEGRGHIWLNGHDLGRFWNITKAGSSNRPTQLYYQLPPDYLNKADGDANDLTIFDVFGSAHVTAQLVLSSLEVSAEPNFKDEVDYLDACI